VDLMVKGVSPNKGFPQMRVSKSRRCSGISGKDSQAEHTQCTTALLETALTEISWHTWIRRRKIVFSSRFRKPHLASAFVKPITFKLWSTVLKQESPSTILHGV
jgi:hypothetical protein